MDNTKLNNLAGRAMGWKLIGVGECEPSGPFYQDSEGESTLGIDMWNPSTCADDALVLMEKMARERTFLLVRYADNWLCLFDGGNITGEESSAALSMTVAALRASGTSEYEIQVALK